MMNRINLTLSTSPQTQPARKPCKTASLALRQRYLYGKPWRNNTGKELDSETGLYYYGARYLDPRVSRWLSGDPALGEYVPQAPASEEARKRNGNLPGMGGVFNYVNLHVYHYAGNNPVKYTDPDGEIIWLPLLIIAVAAVSIINCKSVKNGLPYEPQNWNDNGTIQDTTNCYAYAMNLQRNPSTGENFPLRGGNGRFALQPGELAGIEANILLANDPNYVVQMAIRDAEESGRTFKEIGKNDRVAAGNWKVALVFYQGEDYHFYRQNDDGTWSHKHGENPVTNKDASGQIITDPRAADRGDYTMFIGYYEVGP